MDCTQVLLICSTQAVTIVDWPSLSAAQNSASCLNKMLICSSVSEISDLEEAVLPVLLLMLPLPLTSELDCIALTLVETFLNCSK
jgi:hypothetical protein